MADFPYADVPSRSPLAPVAVRLAESEREQAVARLSDAFARDVIVVEEFERRLEAVYRAADSAELAALTRDLPRAAPEPGERRATGRIVPSGGTRRITAWFSNVERTGATEIPQQLEVTVFAGNVELDLTRTSFPVGVTEIVIRATLGNVELFLPPGVMVENDGGAFLGSFDCHTPDVTRGDVVSGHAITSPASRVVRITGRAVLSNVEITQVPGIQ
jgi:hypothetical protein